MRKNMYVLAVCSILAMASCTGRKSNEKVLENSGNLLVVTSEVVKGDTLMGVRTIFDTIQVVPMDRWDSIRAETPEVVRAYRDGKLYAYAATGKQIGNGALVSLVTVEGERNTFYRATATDGTHCFYFPSSDEVLSGIPAIYIGQTAMLLQTAERWEIRDYEGNLVNQTKDTEICILRRINAKQETIQIIEPNAERVWVYDIQGNLTSRLTTTEWNKATQNFRRTTKIGNATYGELDINYTL